MNPSKKNEKKLSHVDSAGRARMVDVSAKAVVLRRAVARGAVSVSEFCARLIAENNLEKGDVLAGARLAGIIAAKQTPQLVPLCHPLKIDCIEVDCRLEGNQVKITATVTARERTGVEMEALTAVAGAALTVFDMCKAVDPAAVIGPIQVESKHKNDQLTFERSRSNGQGSSRLPE